MIGITKVVENMEGLEEVSKEEIMKNAMEDFREVQRYMILAKEENANKLYAELKEKYIYVKALLNSLGVNITELDKIKE